VAGVGRVDLVQLVRFLVVKLTHSDLNSRFNMSIIFEKPSGPLLGLIMMSH
jgi:hypothetical protein